MMRRALLAIAVLVSATPAGAQQPAAPPAAPAPAATPAAPPEAPKPAPELQKLEFLVGDWIHDETYQPGPMGPGGKGKGISKSAWALGGHHLSVQYASNTPIGKVEGRGFIGWDGEAKSYRMDWFDNGGSATHYAGVFDADGALVLKAEYSLQGQKIAEQFSIKKQDGGSVAFALAMAGADGALKPVFESIASPKK